MACMAGHKLKDGLGDITKLKMCQALDYFNLPECMWPTGMYIINTLRLKYDMLANQFMATIQADIKQLVANDRSYASVFTKSYYLYERLDSLSLEARRYRHSHMDFSQALKSRLKALAAAECLEITFVNANVHECEHVKITVCIP